uniref:Uncharacterized protein n=1 Tax=Lepeophtheirus salmonis TaxID=72036 RepID=A0A0K2UY26_LEPSM
MCLIAEDDFTLKIRIIFEFSFSPFTNSRRLKWSRGFSSCVNLILYGCRPRSFCKISHHDVTDLPND